MFVKRKRRGVRHTEQVRRFLPRIYVPLLHVRLKLERDDDHATVNVRIGGSRRVVAGIGVEDMSADLDGSTVGKWSLVRAQRKEKRRKTNRNMALMKA